MSGESESKTEIEKHIFDSDYDWMIPLEFSFNSLMEAKQKIEKDLGETSQTSQCQETL